MQLMAMSAKRDGMSYDEIAGLLEGFFELAPGEMTPDGAFQLVRSGLRAERAEIAAEVRQLERARLDAIYARAWAISQDTQEATKDRVAALKVALGVSARRATMDGLDAPTKVDARVASYEALSNEQLEAKAREVDAKWKAALAAAAGQDGPSDE